ncbi:unnamed protein product [Discula destructiva]
MGTLLGVRKATVGAAESSPAPGLKALQVGHEGTKEKLYDEKPVIGTLTVHVEHEGRGQQVAEKEVKRYDRSLTRRAEDMHEFGSSM